MEKSWNCVFKFLWEPCYWFFAHVFRAETETKAKLEKVAEIKKINANMMSIKSEISKYEDTLKEYQMYRSFLENLTPPVSSYRFNKYI